MIEVNTGDGSIVSRRAAWAKEPSHIKVAIRLSRAARQRGVFVHGTDRFNAGAVVIFRTRVVHIYGGFTPGYAPAVIQSILPYRFYGADPQWQEALRERQHVRYLDLAADSRRLAASPYLKAHERQEAKERVRYWIRLASQERKAC